MADHCFQSGSIIGVAGVVVVRRDVSPLDSTRLDSTRLNSTRLMFLVALLLLLLLVHS